MIKVFRVFRYFRVFRVFFNRYLLTVSIMLLIVIGRQRHHDPQHVPEEQRDRSKE
jgi:hypothetical protein